MPSDGSRVAATALIWIFTTFILAIALDAVTNLNAVIMVGVILGAASLSTRAVWGSGLRVASHEAAEKSKRTGSRRVHGIVDSLTDDELDELRARLTESDRTVPLETLLRDQSRRQNDI